MNNVHLVCSNLHQIANLHVNPKLNFYWNSPKDLESLFQTSRIFEELEFENKCGYYLSCPEKFQLLEEYLEFLGPNIKTLIIKGQYVDPMIVLKLLNLLPNLKRFVMKGFPEPDVVTSNTKWELKSTKIESFCLELNTAGFENLLESLEKCAIKELELNLYSENEVVAARKFLKAQEKNLKKLTIRSNFDYLADLKDLRLEYLEFLDYGRQSISLEFLRYQIDLKYLNVYFEAFTRENYAAICELKNLKTLILWSESRTWESVE